MWMGELFGLASGTSSDSTSASFQAVGTFGWNAFAASNNASTLTRGILSNDDPCAPLKPGAPANRIVPGAVGPFDFPYRGGSRPADTSVPYSSRYRSAGCELSICAR